MELVESVNVGSSMLLVHHAITRGLDVSVEKSSHFGKNGFPNAAFRAGFASYVIGLTAILRAHHLVEDEVAFPYIKERIPDAPYDVLDNEHRVVEPLVLQARASVERLLNNPSDELHALEMMNSLLVSLREAWGPHIRKEEEYFSPERLSAVATLEEHADLGQRIKEFTEEHAHPDYLVLPFMIYNLAEPDRSEYSRQLPPVVLEHLIPVAWRARWEPMKPFLLL